MSIESEGGILLVKARVCSGPTDLTLPFPCGGTELGLVRGIALRPQRAFDLLTEESFGTEVVEAVDLGESWRVTAGFRSLDSDLVTKVFSITSTGTKSGQKGIVYPIDPTLAVVYRAGRQRSLDAVKLLFYPDDIDRHPTVVLYNAMPFVTQDAELAMQLQNEMIVPVTFIGIRDGSNRVISIKKLEDQIL